MADPNTLSPEAQTFFRNLAAEMRGPIDYSPPAPQRPPSWQDLAAFQGGAQPMLPTLSGVENRPPPAPNWQDLRAFAQPIDYSRPEFAPVTQAVPPEMRGDYYRAGHRPSEGMVARPLAPQSFQEEVDQRANNAALAQGYETGGDLGMLAAGGPIARGIGAGTRAAVAAGRAAPRTTAAVLGATGLTAAPGAANEPTPLSTAQSTIARLRASQTDLEAEQKRLVGETTRFKGLQQRGAPAVLEAQQFLQEQGLYLRDDRGRQLRADGVWGPGMSLAIEAYQKRIGAAQEKTDRQLVTVGKDLTTQEDRLRGIERDQRVNEASRDMSVWDRTVRDYATPAGFVTGAVAGPAMRWGMTRGANAYRQAMVNRADALVARTPRQTEQRVGNVNRFYTQGGAEPPFRVDPSAPRGFVPNAPQAPATSLYPPGRQWRVGDTGAQAGFATETGFAHHQLQGAQEELTAARTAADREPSEANIRRVRDAEVNVGLMTFLERAGLGASVSYPLAGTKLRYGAPQPRLERAEAEVLRLNRLGAPPAAPPPPATQGGRERWPPGTPGGLGGRFK